MSELLINAGVFGVLIPAGAACAAGLASRFDTPMVRGLAGLGVGSGVWVAASRLGGPVPWPPVDASQWVPIAAVFGAALGAAVGPVSGLALVRARPVVAALVRAVFFAALSGWVLAKLLAPLSQHTWDAGQSAREVWRLIALGTLAYVGIDALFETRRAAEPERRFNAFVSVAAAGVILGGAAAIVALARSALFGQLLGAVAAALGGLALATLTGVRRDALRSGAPALALPLVVVVAASQHYASLPPWSAALLLVAPALAAAAVLGAPRGGRWWTHLGGVVVAALVVGGIGAWTQHALDGAEASAATSTPGEPELDYGYGGSEEPAESANEAPDPYGDPRLKDWKPPE